MVALIATVVKILCFVFFKLYKSLWRHAGAYELFSIVTATFVSNCAMLAIVFINGWITGSLLAPRSVFGIAFFLDAFFIGGARLAYRVLRRMIRGEFIRLSGARRVMIIGGGCRH